MKLLKLEIENYGLYCERTLEFGPRPFRLVYGPNETGKSTLLQLIRDLLFGFPHSSPYVSDDHTGRLAATATVELANGERLAFRRQKGRVNTVSGTNETTGARIDDETLESLLGGAGAELYQHVFGFSLSELAAGEQSLGSASLTETLFGGGLGNLAVFHETLRELNAEHRDLFTARGQKPVINALAARHRSQVQELRELELHPQEYLRLQREYRAQQEHVQELAETLAGLRQRKSHLQRLQRALPLWSQQRALRAELAEIALEHPLPVTARDQLKALDDRLLEIDDELGDLDKCVVELRAEKESLAVPEELLEHADQIEALLEDVGRINTFYEDMPQRRREAQSCRETVKQCLREIHSEWGAEAEDAEVDAARFRDAAQVAPPMRLSTSQQSQFRELSEQEQTLRVKLETLANQLADAEQEFDAVCSRLEQLDAARPTEAPRDLQALAAQGAEMCSRSVKAQELHEQTQTLGRQLAVEEARVRQLFITEDEATEDENAPQLADLPLPLPEQVEEFQQQWDETSGQCERCAARLQTKRDELAELERTRDELQRLQPVPSREELERLRQRRDDLLRSVLRELAGVELEDRPQDAAERAMASEAVALSGPRSNPGTEDPRWRELVQFIACCDDLADERQQNAETVARLEQLQLQCHAVQRQIEELQAVSAEATAAWESVQSRWSELWRPLGIDPLQPAAMRQWLSTAEDVRARSGDLQRLELKRDQLQDDVQGFSSRLCSLLQVSSKSLTELLHVAESRLQECREHATQRRHLEQTAIEQRARRDQLREQVAALKAELETWRDRWFAALSDAGFPPDWTIGTVNAVIQELGRVRDKTQEAESLEQRVRDMDREAKAYTQRVGTLAEALGRSLEDSERIRPTTWVSQLHQELLAARQARTRQLANLTELKRVDGVREARLQRRRELAEARTQLLDEAGVDGPAEFEQCVEESRKLRALQDQLREVDVELRGIRQEADAEDFRTELQSADPDQLVAELEQVDVEIQRLEEDHHAAATLEGEHRSRLNRLSRDEQLLKSSTELESTRAQLQSAVDRWAPLYLAEQMIRRSIERFERQQQPEMLQVIGEILGQLTLGRHVALRRQLDERGTLLVTSADGTSRTPEMLSTGTREQLYLAIRLAFLQHYCRRHEPLPVVMDDVLVNFDHERMQQTIDVLQALDPRIQVLLLTCHRHTAELVRGHYGDEAIVYLSDEHRLKPEPPRRRSRSRPDDKHPMLFPS